MVASKVAVDRRRSSEKIRAAAIALFKSRGYHGTSIRDLAKAVNIESATLYYHFSSKQAILLDLFLKPMDAMLEGIDIAVMGVSTPPEQLRAAVRFHVLFHIARQDEAFITHSELRSLTQRNKRLIVPKRDQYERKMRALLEAGVKSGDFEVADVKVMTIALLMMCSGVSDWFAGHGRLTPVALADLYADMAMRLVTAR